MPLVFVTGVSGSGKTTIARELVRRGYEAYDTEHDDMSAWYDTQTGARVAGLNEMPERTKTWLDTHEWRISVERVAAISKDADDRVIFLCGGSANEAEIRRHCQLLIWLQIDEATIRQRVQLPRENDFGIYPHELASVLAANSRKFAEYRTLGATIINATQPLQQVVDTVLAIASKAFPAT